MTSSSPAGSPHTPERLPNATEILRYLSGAAQLMAGRAEGLKRLDLSADGFWASFMAIPVALPPIALSWVEFETLEREVPLVAGPASIYGAHALADFIAWVLPVLLLMLIARPIGFSRKIVPLVVATNWGGALLAWLAAPCWLLLLVLETGMTGNAFGLIFTVVAIALTIRLTATAIGRDLPAAVGFLVLTIASTLTAYGAVTDVTGIALL